MPAEIVTWPRAAIAPQPLTASAVSAAHEILPPDAQLRVGVFQATKVLAPFVPSKSTNLRSLARIIATAVALNAPPDWRVSDLVDWLTTTAPTQEEA